jgi:predicted phosphodiesterase
MKKFLLIIFAMLVLTVGQAFAENIKFIQVTDVHLNDNNEYSKKVLESAVEDINNQQGISFVVFTGDNIGSPREENLRSFLRLVSKLNVPYYIVLGNHDVYKSNGLSKVRYFELVKSHKFLFHQRKPNYKFKKNGFVFLLVDGAKEVIPGTVGYYRKDTLDWVEKELRKNKRKDVVIFQHFPVEYPEISESRIKSHKTYKVEEYQALLEKHTNVLAVVSGHFHVNSENMKNGVYHITSPALLMLPHSYKVIDIVTTKEFSPIIYTQLREFEVKD